MVEPIITTLPTIPTGEVREPMVFGSGSPPKTGAGFIASFALHSLVIGMLLIPGFFYHDTPTTAPSGPVLRAVMIAPSQLNRLLVIPEQEPSAKPESIPAKKESAPTYIENNPAVEEPNDGLVIKKKIDPFSQFNERLARVREEQARFREARKEDDIDTLVQRLRAARTPPAPRENAEEAFPESLLVQKKEGVSEAVPTFKPETIGQQKEVRRMSMDPLFLYQNQIAEKIRSYMRAREGVSGECSLGLTLSRDGHVVKIRAHSGDDQVCEAATRAVIRADVFPMPKDEALYAALNSLQITVSSASSATTVPSLAFEHPRVHRQSVILD